MRYFSLILILFTTPTLCFGESYLCIGDKLTGFSSKNEFSQANFKPQKWIINHLNIE